MNRKEKLVTEQIYHVYNRGVEKRIIFTYEHDYRRFIDCAFHYLFSNERYSDAVNSLENGLTTTFREVTSRNEAEDFVRPVDIIAYCLMPNHIHFLVKQLVDRGISKYVHKISTSFTNYFNLKYDRVGSLFQGPFKYKRIETEEQLLYLTKYIHRNPLEIIRGADSTFGLGDYPWSSLPAYLGTVEEPLLKELVLASYPSVEAYRNFVAEEDIPNKVEGLGYLNLES
ncbi:MAG: transposase [Patescibacteria group bacterium]